MDDTTPAEAREGAPAAMQGGKQRRPRPLGLRILALGAVMTVVVGFAPAAHVAASRLPVPPQDQLWPVASSGSAAKVRALPVALPPGPPVNTPADLAETARRALGRSGARSLLSLLSRGEPWLVSEAQPWRKRAPYPYRYARLDRILDGAPKRGATAASTALGAALTVLATRPGAHRNAAPAAFAVLHRARSGGGCDAQLNLLLLVSAEIWPRDQVVRREADRAESRCPGDPTPGWLLAQYESQRAIADQPSPTGSSSPGAQHRASARLEELVQSYPRSGDVLAAAADFELRAALQVRADRPFSARHALRLAAARYRAAVDLGSEEAVGGLARALTGAGDPDAAIAALFRSVDDLENPGRRLEVLLAAQEGAHRFADAEQTARRLRDLGARAYPRGSRLFPAPGLPGINGSDLAGPMSVGSDRAATLTVVLRTTGFALAAANVATFTIPPYRSDPDFVGTQPSCPEWAWRRDAVLAGHAGAALVDFPRGGKRRLFTSVRPEQRGESCGPSDPARFRRLLVAEAGEQIRGSRGQVNQVFDGRQNLWRWAGALAEAERVTRVWNQRAGARHPLSLLRLAEITYLRGRYDESALLFGTIARLRSSTAGTEVGVLEALLGRGAALLAARRRSEGLSQLRTVADSSMAAWARLRRADLGERRQARLAAVAYFAHAKLADDELDHEEWHAAAEDYQAARELVPGVAEDSWVRPESLFGNQAVAELALSRVSEARAAIDRALSRDPRSPVFLMTSGFIADRADDRALAVEENTAALVSDPGAFPAANDLGVQLVRAGDLSAAVTAFRKAVGARPDYALGWFNLGVVLSRMGVPHLLGSQGAFARAFAIDPELKEREREPTIDAGVYRTGLDLSAPLPGGWSFSGLERQQPAASLGLLATALMVIGLARAAGKASRKDLAKRWLEPATKRAARFAPLSRIRRPVWSFAVVAVVFGAPAVLAGLDVTSAVALACGVLALAGVSVQARKLAALVVRREVHQRSWAPGMAFGLVATPLGVAWAPLPVTAEAASHRAVYAAAPATLAVAAAVLFLEDVFLHVPLTGSLATATVVMAASTLLPVEPLDGARLRRKTQSEHEHEPEPEPEPEPDRPDVGQGRGLTDDTEAVEPEPASSPGSDLDAPTRAAAAPSSARGPGL